MQPVQHAQPGRRGRPDAATRPTLRVLRAVVALQAVLVLAQAAFAGQFLSGNAAARLWHQGNAELIQLVALAQLVAAAVAWARGGPAWPTAASGLLLLAVGAQVALGYTHQVAVHVPLGVAILGLTVWLLAGLHPARPRE
jgi:hypothetical protein